MGLNEIAKRVASKLPKLPKLPRSMRVSNPTKIISRLWKEYETDSKWDGKLHKVGPGNYYHVSEEGAEFYKSGHPSGEINTISFPSISSCALLNLENEEHIQFLYKLSEIEDPSYVDDIGLLIEGSLQKFKQFGFDCLIINGETGSGVEGPSIEVVLL